MYQWWIRSHRRIIKNFLDKTPYKVKYYGGFALNVLLGCKDLPSPLGMLTCYNKGLEIVGHSASDIDAKILGVKGKEEEIVDALLLRADTDKILRSLPEEIQAAALKTSTLPKSDIYVIDKPHYANSPNYLVVAHKKFYMNPEIDTKPHYQIIFIGVYQDFDGEWKSQILSELTPMSDPVPEGSDFFTNTDLPTLLTQFEKLHKSLTDGRRSNPERLTKTVARIAAIKTALGITAAANGSSEAAGGVAAAAGVAKPRSRSKSRSRSRSKSRGGGIGRRLTRRRGPNPRRGSVKK